MSTHPVEPEPGEHGHAPGTPNNPTRLPIEPEFGPQELPAEPEDPVDKPPPT